MRDERAIRTEVLLKLFLEDSVLDEKEHIVREIVKFYRGFGRHQYHLVSRFVYDQMNKSQDTIDFMLSNILYVIYYLIQNQSEAEVVIRSEGFDGSIDDIILWTEKLYDHIALEEERLINNSKVIEISKRDIESGVINRFNGIADGFQRRVDDISNTLNANIITVVGLFSAIIFVFFGGITSLSSFVNGIFRISSAEELRYPLLALLVIGFIMFNTIFLLLYTISKIVNKNIGCWVSFSYRNYYNVQKTEDGYYIVRDINDRKIKCFCRADKARRYISVRKFFSKIKYIITKWFKKIVLRFPIVFMFDLLILASIIYVFCNLK